MSTLTQTASSKTRLNHKKSFLSDLRLQWSEYMHIVYSELKMLTTRSRFWSMTICEFVSLWGWQAYLTFVTFPNTKCTIKNTLSQKPEFPDLKILWKKGQILGMVAGLSHLHFLFPIENSYLFITNFKHDTWKPSSIISVARGAAAPLDATCSLQNHLTLLPSTHLATSTLLPPCNITSKALTWMLWSKTCNKNLMWVGHWGSDQLVPLYFIIKRRI